MPALRRAKRSVRVNHSLYGIESYLGSQAAAYVERATSGEMQVTPLEGQLVNGSLTLTVTPPAGTGQEDRLAKLINSKERLLFKALFRAQSHGGSNLFRRVFPRQYARLQADGHVLRRR